MQHPIVVLLMGLVVSGLGAAIVVFRHRLATFFRRRQERQGLPLAASQTPAMGLIVGIGWIVFGLYGVLQALIRLSTA